MFKLKKKNKFKTKEKIVNVPNFITLIRFILSFVIIFIAFYKASLLTIAIVFIIGALTDFFDGYIARKYNQVTRFGRKFDIFADRLFMVCTMISLVVYVVVHQMLSETRLILFILVLTREILSLPALIIALFIKNSGVFPHARMVGKVMTALQGITIPVIVIGWPFATILTLITALNGVIAACYYWNDSIINPNNKFQKKLDVYYRKIEG